MKTGSVVILMVCALILFPGSVLAETVEGTVQGFTCVTKGEVCPVGKEDPVIAAERLFVVLAKSGKDHWFVPNLDRGIMARHINKMVRVTGKLSKKYSSISAEKLEVMQNGKWKTTWSPQMERDVYGH